MIIEKFTQYRIAYRKKDSGELIGYSREYETTDIARKMLKLGSQPTEQIETFIIKEEVTRETIKNINEEE